MEVFRFYLKYALMAVLVGFGLTACGGDDPDVPIVPPTTLSTDVSTINLVSSKSATGFFSIRTDAEWEIYGQDESWLSLSSTSGSGNATITITAKTTNNSATPRECTLHIIAGDATADVVVVQESGLATCKVTPANITSLYFAVAFNLDYTSDVRTCKLLLITDYDMKHKTEAELIQAIEAKKNAIPEDSTIYTMSVKPNTKYHILSLAYDEKDNRGEMGDVEFISPAFLSDTDDAWCSFDDATYNNTIFKFTVHKQGRCARYHIIYGTNISLDNLNSPLMAFEINYYIKNHKKNWLSEMWGLKIETDYPNDHTFTCPLSTESVFGGLIAAAWGIFSDGTLSSDLHYVAGDMYSNDCITSPDYSKHVEQEPGKLVKYTPASFNK